MDNVVAAVASGKGQAFIRLNLDLLVSLELLAFC